MHNIISTQHKYFSPDSSDPLIKIYIPYICQTSGVHKYRAAFAGIELDASHSPEPAREQRRILEIHLGWNSGLPTFRGHSIIKTTPRRCLSTTGRFGGIIDRNRRLNERNLQSVRRGTLCARALKAPRIMRAPRDILPFISSRVKKAPSQLNLRMRRPRFSRRMINQAGPRVSIAVKIRNCALAWEVREKKGRNSLVKHSSKREESAGPAAQIKSTVNPKLCARLIGGAPFTVATPIRPANESRFAKKNDGPGNNALTPPGIFD